MTQVPAMVQNTMNSAATLELHAADTERHDTLPCHSIWIQGQPVLFILSQ